MARDFGHEDAGRASAESLSDIVRNRVIDRFLREDDRLYVVGPKGTGKTLLLKRKAIDQRRLRTTLCIPSEPALPVDRLTASAHLGTALNRAISDEGENHVAWTAIWKHSILSSVLHHLTERIVATVSDNAQRGPQRAWVDEREYSKLQGAREDIRRLIGDATPLPRRPFFYYTQLCAQLDAAPRRALRRVQGEVNDLHALMPLSAQAVYVFLDNLDDYYELEPGLWYRSMYGQFRAIREISLTHPNIHVFTSLRRDVYSQFSDEMILQYYDYVALLEYTKDEILKVFETRLRRLDEDLLVDPDRLQEDAWRAFFGECVTIRNDFIGVDENIRDYLYRHSLGRPRDMVHIGTVLLAERDDDAFKPATIRRAVARACETIIEQYMAETRPLTDPRVDLAEFMRKYVHSNILTRADAVATRQEFWKDNGPTPVSPTGDEMPDPFSELHKIGLLGVVAKELGTNNLIQHFEPSGRGPSYAGTPGLPDSQLYFLHPALRHFLGPSENSSAMIVGYGCPVLST